MTIKFLFLILFVIFLGGCSSQSQQNTNNGMPVLSDIQVVFVTPLQLKNLEIKLIKPEKKILTEEIHLNGKVQSLPNNRAIINSNISGIVDKILIHEGDIVQKGQVLMILSSMEFIELQESFLTAKSEKDLLDIKFRRQEEMMRKEIGALADFQTIEAQRREANNRKKALTAKLELLGVDVKKLEDSAQAVVSPYLYIKSPINGYVTNLPVAIGQLIKGENVLVEIVNTDELVAEMAVYDKDLDEIKVGLKLQLDFVNHTFPPVEGSVTHIARSIDPVTKAGMIYVYFKAPKNHLVLPGMSVHATLSEKQSEQATAYLAPLSAFLEQDESYYIFYTSESSEDEHKPIKIRKEKVSIEERNDDVMEFNFLNPAPPSFLIANGNVAVLENYLISQQP
ncbi:MAG: efflux RND transporter periplasmic adaptor subunit [Cytophagales bacterium]|nr:efflux RND transporter periplasmic adaptor subunit [Cytophagales bacterium]MDW8383327.1 efflux RND transporter periplasmic adaptor subunit [Flammeovirgaceae bacterium]